jgi:pyruvate/2-oxoglutarate/acetoin dehydrogenase E1 component
MPTVLESLNGALHDAMAADERVLVLGEDVLDPYGGAFKVTKGLSTAHPDRVLTTPVSEGGIVGVAAGMALRGLRPVVEIMFGDFTTLIVDQLANGAAKFGWMFDDQVQVPLVVRTPMGGRRGYGPTHSQSIEKLFCGVPGLRVLAAGAVTDPGALLRAAIDDDGPVLFVENKVLYPMPVLDRSTAAEIELEVHEHVVGAPSCTLRVAGGGPPTVTLAAHGHMAELARAALVELAYEHEVFAELVVVTQLAPCDVTAVAGSVARTGRLVVAEEATPAAGWGAEVVARLAEHDAAVLRHVRRVAAAPVPIPASGRLEAEVLPDVGDIVAAALVAT